jgi:putative spermidine/putrescine transport system permease protein
MMRSATARVCFVGVVGMLVLFLAGPSLLMAAASVSASSFITFPPKGFSVHWYAFLLTDRRLQVAFVNTAVVALVCTATSVVTGTLAALAMPRLGRSLGAALQICLLLPFTIPIIVEAVGILNIYDAIGAVGSRAAIGVAIAAANLPFVVGTVGAAANRLDPYLDEAAASCGAPPIERFVTVTLPSVMPGILAGALIMFITAFNEFVVSAFLVDVRTMTLPVDLFNQARGTATPAIAAVSVLYMLVSALAVLAVDRLVGIQVFLRSPR